MRVLGLLEKKVEASRQAWESTALIARSLSRWVSADWVARDIKARLKLDYKMEAFPMVDDNLALQFRGEEDWNAAIVDSPLVAGQVLAMEPWASNFVLGVDLVKKMLVWFRLASLPLEYYEKESILDIAAAARCPLALDEFTDPPQKLGYTWIKLEIDIAEPLKLRIFIQGGARTF
ncbi:uncharacterized protein LOC120110087 [Phoenix dactylifera]|uniref:Uncharacterized protein LOC120110087 n=1 Tax=Phoenix dactylifera TaxID=42345 RepID=A0A8B9A2T5_PHODC|nr:uncharacterized protein LOC120110087 [Phoenix dactylifera]